ncbi:hypothetical protein M501DRAFT_454869 [Patellaria atrata CBS 101060]|uniref:Uncharacterized protein n=1 Tax=Patellaria atrata CBS 101060 TaxID=1346257 RepID=A0A9P4S362_9PEZI|nr:hypothetical protein M501DRAFT_454869 [Patellaria atrata CBS 101060]
MSSKRKITIFESQYDAAKLKSNGYQFQIAKTVLKGSGEAETNMVWKSKAIAPVTAISWDVVYALNWTADLTYASAQVTVGGVWQQCNKDQGYELGPDGYWVASSVKPKPGYMLAKINYQYPETSGIKVIIGVQNESGDYDPVFVDTVSMPPGSTGQYQPQESVTWWYEAGNLTATMISSNMTNPGGVNLSAPAPTTNKYEWWTTFIFDDGKWLNSQQKPAPSLHGPPPFIAPIASNPGFNGLIEAPSITGLLYPIVCSIVFGVAVKAAQQTDVAQKITDFISQTNLNVKATWTLPNGKELQVTYGKPKNAPANSIAAIAFLASNVDAVAPVNAALESAKARGLFPPGETWEVHLTSY